MVFCLIFLLSFTKSPTYSTVPSKVDISHKMIIHSIRNDSYTQILNSFEHKSHHSFFNQHNDCVTDSNI